MQRAVRGPLLWTIVGALVIGYVVACTPAAQPTAGPTAVLDHYLCYFPDEIAFNPPNNVGVIDQFKLPPPVAFVQREYLCNPVEKWHGWWRHYPIKRENAHLFCYRFDRKPVTGRVDVSNQLDPSWFATQKLALQESWMLCLPAGKGSAENPNPPPIPTDLDHFKCYSVKPDDPTADSVDLKDQFLPKRVTVDVRNAAFLCNPAEKRKAGKTWPPGHTDAHLVCYFISLSLPQPQKKHVANQFEPNFVVNVTKNPPILCVPSTKKVIEEVRETNQPSG
jgi:hypothetical protein